MSYRIVLDKENFKFSCSHFTIFGASRAERLHGHNYQVTAQLNLKSVDDSLAMAFDFNLIKPIIREITASLDEHVLLPAQSSHLKIETFEDSVHAQIGAKKYVFPLEDVKVLPLANITSEALAAHVTKLLVDRLLTLPEANRHLASLSIGVQETRGQTVFYDWNFAQAGKEN